mmetsp:Transcript_20885/g.53884  ORF Transcript_20885/g.53884 Transcript_20885/m.53884 type:complete len:84 (+) Transcript_20885:707-958(+)
MQDKSLLEGSKPATLAGAALALAYTELPRIDGMEPLTAAVLAKQLQLSPGTINNALKEIKPMRKKHLETLSIAAAGELSGSGN